MTRASATSSNGTTASLTRTNAAALSAAWTEYVCDGQIRAAPAPGPSRRAGSKRASTASARAAFASGRDRDRVLGGSVGVRMGWVGQGLKLFQPRSLSTASATGPSAVHPKGCRPAGRKQQGRRSTYTDSGECCQTGVVGGFDREDSEGHIACQYHGHTAPKRRHSGLDRVQPGERV